MATHQLTAAIAVQLVQLVIQSAIQWALTFLSRSLLLIMDEARPTALKKTTTKSRDQ